MKFKTPDNHSKLGYHERNDRVWMRESEDWENIPLAAIPIYEKDWPKMPKNMNGRQYFFWKENGFKKNKAGDAITKSPYPQLDKVIYVQAGGESRRWGA